MVELSFSLGKLEANTLETTMLLFSFSSVLQWCFFIMIIIPGLVKLHNKKENAPTSKKKHSHKH